MRSTLVNCFHKANMKMCISLSDRRMYVFVMLSYIKTR